MICIWQNPVEWGPGEKRWDSFRVESFDLLKL